MKRFALILTVLSGTAALAQPGFEIKVTFKPFRNQYIYLGHYFGRQYPIIDSVLLDANSEAVFKGKKELPGGIYLIGYPGKKGFFEILVDRQQKFSVIADTATLSKGPEFRGSPDNTLFSSYQRYMMTHGREITNARNQIRTATTDSAKWNRVIRENDSLMNKYRETIIKEHPGTLLTAYLLAMRDPELPEGLKNPGSKEDSIKTYRYFKDHYWDGVNFWDGRLAYTPFFEDRVDRYYKDLVIPHPDSVIREIDHMMGYAVANEEMTRFLLLKFVNRYLNQKYMWEDAVFVHLFEKYFAQKSYSWLTDAGRKTITDRAYSLMANIMGSPASDILLPDSNAMARSLYSDTNAAFTLVAFWDPTCGHCREVIPKLDSMYQAKWKKAGLQIFSVAKETDGTRNDWLRFIREYGLKEWTHVYYSRAEEKTRIEAGVPGYSQLYDVQSFPTLYLLDRDKRIIAKKLSWEQMDEVLQVKLEGK